MLDDRDRRDEPRHRRRRTGRRSRSPSFPRRSLRRSTRSWRCLLRVSGKPTSRSDRSVQNRVVGNGLPHEPPGRRGRPVDGLGQERQPQRPRPTRRSVVRNQEPPLSGISPTRAKACTNRDESPAITTSQASARLAPAPAATPCTAATTGFVIVAIRRTSGLYPAFEGCAQVGDLGRPPEVYRTERSCPEQKPRFRTR